MKKIWKQALCLLLSLELFISPVAMARAQGALWDERPEPDWTEPARPEDGAPAEDEQPAAHGEDDQPVTPAEYLPYFSRVVVGGGVDVSAKYHGYFVQEATGNWGAWGDYSAGDEEIYYVKRDMGRLPDLEFEGYYVYEHEDVLALLNVDDVDRLRNTATSWSFDQIQAQDAPIKLGFLSYNELPADIQTLLRDDAVGVDHDAPFAAHLAGSYGKIVATDDWSGNNLPLVGRWVESSKAQAMELAMTTGNAKGETEINTLYTADIAGKDLGDMADSDVLDLADFDGSTDGEFWLRVPNDQERLTLSFTAFEPYFDYLKQNQPGDELLKTLTAGEAEAACPVTVSVTYGADKREVPLAEDAIEGRMVNGGSREYGGVEYNYYFSQNGTDKPARSHWTVREIPLTVADGGADPVTTVTVTLAAPNGVEKVRYIFHIARLAEQTATLGAGNSPVGTILRDNSAIWREQKTYTDSDSGEIRYFVDYSDIDRNNVDAVLEANKRFAIQEFARRLGYHGAYYPQESANLRQGAVYRGTYSDQWAGENLDLSESAVFVYPDTAFEDPGVSFTDSEGRAVFFGEAAADPRYENCVARLIKLRTADSLTVELYTNVAGQSTEVYYDGTKTGEERLQTTATANWLRKEGGRDQVDLRGLRIVPGIYKILYVFTDPLTGDEIRASRPLVVLPIPGDVDMDGAVTPADGVALEKNMTLWNEASGATVQLVRSRVMDVTGTGNLTAGDVNKLLAGFQPELAKAGGGDYRYIPLPQGDSAVTYTRKNWDEVDAMLPDGAAGRLVLEYLGVETGLYNAESGTTAQPTGPWQAKGNLGVSLPSRDDNNSTFWMGVRLELEDESALQGRRVEDLTVSLIYDSRYVRPATVLTSSLLEQLEGSGVSTPESRWLFMLRYYNLLAGSYLDGGVEPKTLWGNRGTLRYDLSGATVQSRNYDTTHYSKVISRLEENTDAQYLREMVFSVKDAGIGGTELRSGYVLAVPFTLYRQPTGAQEYTRTRLVELSGGMRDLNMVTAPGSGRGLLRQARAALLANVPATTSAFSAQESIYGNATQNLREELSCDSASAGLVLLGKDNSTRTPLLNELTSPASPAKYATDFSVGTRRMGAVFSGQLPRGVSYNQNTGIISGLPEETGTFTFELDGLPFSLTVEPRTIRFYADGYNTYYGEVELRGQSPVSGKNETAVLPGTEDQQYRTFTYRYYSEDVAAIDRARAEAAGISWTTAASRSGDELGQYIEGYTEPAFAASTQTRQEVGDGVPTGDWVEERTPVGDYDIYAMTKPQADNYVFEYVHEAPVGERQGVNILTVLQRPMRIDYLVIPSASNPTKTLYHDEGEGVRENMTAYMGEEGVELAFTHLTYAELPLSGPALVAGDKVGLTFNGKFLRTEADKAGGGKGFILQAKQEDRQLEVSALRLVDVTDKAGVSGDCVKNYMLNTVTYGHPEQFDVRGIVVRRGVTEIEITQLPPELDPNRPGGQTVIYTGGGINDPGQLGMILHKGSGAGAEDVALYRYDNLESLSLGIHYNWVTPEEYARYRYTDTLEGTGRDLTTGRDLRPYGRVRDGVVVEGMEEQRFTPAENGWRVCISVNIFSEGDDQGYMKYYTDPIIVRPRQITLAPQSIQRYYGDPNGDLTYTYSTSTLSNADLSKITEHFGHRATGAMEELEWLLEEERLYYNSAYPGKYTVTAPTITAQVSPTNDTPVDAGSNAQGTPYTIVLTGASSVNYNFSYRSADGTTNDQQGLSNLTVHPRPIVVDTVTRCDTSGQPEPFAILYADTKKLTQTGDRSLRVGGDRPEVTFRLPEQNSEGKPHYYVHRPAVGNQPAGATTVNSQVVLGSGGAVVNGDEAELTVRYSTTFVPDKISHNSFTDSYYPVHSFDGTDTENAHRDEVQADGSRHVSVQVDTLELEGAAARNYLLVYASTVGAMQRVPNTARQVLAPNPTAPAGQQASYSYQTSGFGKVWLRPIKSMTLTALGQMEYTYGERFSPDLAGPKGGVLTLAVEYETEYDNDLAHNTQSDTVYFSVTGSGNSFTDLGFTMGYAQQGQTVEAAFNARQTLDYLEYLTPGIHDGTYLWVVGRRSPQDPLIYSRLSSVPLTVRKRTLTLTASDVHRFYGEVDTVKGPYTFTTLARDLAEPDWRALGYSSEPGVSVRVDAQALQTLAGYRAPTFRSDATPGSPVGERGYGVYDLHMTSGGNWDNYIIQTEGASVYVYPRPIHTTGIASDERNPVYVIFHNAQDVVFESQLGTKRDESFGAATATVQVGLLVTGLEYVELASGETDYLPVTGNALYGSDQLTFNIRVDYGKFDATGDFADKNDIETVTSILSLAGGNRNYRLANTSIVDYPTIGAARLRTIHQIHIVNPPKLEYTYGEELNLSGLQVRIEYARLNETEESEFITVSYQGQAQFKSYGLYINYYGSGSIPADATENKAVWKAVPETYRVADSGDHVTIAPTHDTQGYAATHTSPLYQQFKANGMNLIISAFQEGEKQVAARPVIVGALDARDYYEGTPTPIVVRPRQLTYTLEASDKTYDGTTATAGTLTLTNVFQQEGRVDAYNLSGVTDVVYVPLGADYESASLDHNSAAFAGFKARVVGGRVAFNTGSYTENGTAPLMGNGRLTWSANGTEGTYRYGTGLTFAFTNPNVHYEDDSFAAGRPGLGTAELARYWAATQDKNTVTTRWDSYRDVSELPVEVTGMVLAGPDAANYTWGPSTEPRVDRTDVTVATRAQTERGQAAVPFATIHKANRDTIQGLLSGNVLFYPKLEVDRHTNVVRMTYEQELKALGDNNNRDQTGQGAATVDAFRDELHFEYALYYRDQETGLYTQWAGPSGGKSYQDTLFFGGEAVRPATAEGFLPNPDQLPRPDAVNENTVYKGQLYRWAELDTGLSALGWREDNGFTVDPSAYPGGAAYRDNYWFYSLYATDRTALPRDTVMYPLVRLAETHNYNASGALSGSSAATADLVDAAQRAVAAHRADPEDEALLAQAKAASDAIFGAPTEKMRQEALFIAQLLVERDYTLGATSQWPETPPEDSAPAAAVKTFIQRVDLVSASQQRGDPKLVQGDQEYLVSILEAVWFTDTLRYEEQRYLDAVLYNHPTRYYGYYYDVDLSAEISFTEAPLFDLSDIIGPIPIRRQLGNGQTAEETIVVNQGNTLTLYVQINANDGRKVRYLELQPNVINAVLGDAPIALEVLTIPEKPSNRRYRWTTSDPAVATVDENGVVTFRGLGTAVITIYTDNHRRASATVYVRPQVTALSTGTLFNTFYTGSFLTLSEDGLFYPKSTIRRGDLVLVLDLFRTSTALEGKKREMSYVDVTQGERYADALARMTAIGVVTGVPGNAFEGEREATRGEFAAMIARYIQLDVWDTRGRQHRFLDAGEKETWAYSYIDALAQTGFMLGTGNDRFDPNRPITREEVAAVLARLLTIPLNTLGVEPQKPADVVPENWAYEAILRAVNTVEFPQPYPGEVQQKLAQEALERETGIIPGNKVGQN